MTGRLPCRSCPGKGRGRASDGRRLRGHDWSRAVGIGRRDRGRHLRAAAARWPARGREHDRRPAEWRPGGRRRTKGRWSGSLEEASGEGVAECARNGGSRGSPRGHDQTPAAWRSEGGQPNDRAVTGRRQSGDPMARQPGAGPCLTPGEAAAGGRPNGRQTGAKRGPHPRRPGAKPLASRGKAPYLARQRTGPAPRGPAQCDGHRGQS